MPHYTAIVTLLAVLFYFFLATRVAAARGTFGVKLPAIAGQVDFERVFRVHMNTLEWMPIFLPLLWLCAIYFSDAAQRWSASFGLEAGSLISPATPRRWKSDCPVLHPRVGVWVAAAGRGRRHHHAPVVQLNRA